MRELTMNEIRFVTGNGECVVGTPSDPAYTEPGLETVSIGLPSYGSAFIKLLLRMLK